MSSFTKPLMMTVHDGDICTKPFELVQSFDYITNVDFDAVWAPPHVISVPAGYRTDFASIPRFFWRILPPIGKYGKAAVVHDWLCDESPKRMSSDQAADVFNEAMEVLKVGPIKRCVMTKAVKWFGPLFKAGDK